MYAIIQTRLKPSEEDRGNHQFGIAPNNKSYTNLSGTIHSIKFVDIAGPLIELTRSEFQEVNIGFYLVLE